MAWAEFGPPEELPNIHHRKEYEAGLVAAPDYRITCIFVDRRYRRGGVAALALRGALDLISQAGGGVVEGYPHDMSKHPEGKKMSSSFLYNGTRRMYEAAGFTYQRSKGQKNCVMIRTIVSSLTRARDDNRIFTRGSAARRAAAGQSRRSWLTRVLPSHVS